MKLSEFKKQLNELEVKLLLEYKLTDDEVYIQVINPCYNEYRWVDELEFDEEDNCIYLA